MSSFSRVVSIIVAVLFVSSNCNAFSPLAQSTKIATSTSSLQMGLFDFFQSPEEKEKARLRKEAEIEEQERLLAEMRERRTNPDKMEEYEENVLRRRTVYKNTKRDWEKLEDKVGESGYVDAGEQ